jgi:hypothetical protein
MFYLASLDIYRILKSLHAFLFWGIILFFHEVLDRSFIWLSSVKWAPWIHIVLLVFYNVFLVAVDIVLKTDFVPFLESNEDD